MGFNAILAKTWDMTNREELSERDSLQAISIALQANEMKLD
jgi:hypothetical protein